MISRANSWIVISAALALSNACRQPTGVDKRTGTDGPTGPTATTGATGGTGTPTRSLGACVCVTQPTDLDGDCEPDAIEDTNGNGSYDAGTDFASLQDPDTDSDGILDGCEDWNHNGVVNTISGESSPTNADSDGDGIPDGIEDANKNGLPDPGESSAAQADDDGDGIPDGLEDRNGNGLWDCPENPTGPPCETKANDIDTDGDGLIDSIELKTFVDPAAENYVFCVRASLVNPTCSAVANFKCEGLGAFAGKDGVMGTLDDQTCPWQADSDGDGLIDGLEDRNSDGLVSTRETNPRLADTDTDGLIDSVEDLNKDGVYDQATETDPSRIDSDEDGIPDGVEDSGGCVTDNTTTPPTCSGEPSTGIVRCICGFWRDGKRQPFESDPRKRDTDEDGLPDGAEDRNGDGVCQLPAPRDIPRASDETCAFDNDSDGDLLSDGAEDKNGNGLIDAALEETDARRADPDNDCLNDADESFTLTDPFRPDTDEDGLPDGLESADRLRFDQATRTCIPLNCGALTSYLGPVCTNPLVRDSDSDGFVDGYETINGVPTGEDENADGCLGLLETNPCLDDTIEPPVIGDPMATVCTLGDPAQCAARDIRKCDKCSATSPPANFCGGDSSTCNNELAACPETSPCKKARKIGQALICAEGNIRPVLLVRSEQNDYNVALVAVRGVGGAAPVPLFDFAEAAYVDRPIGHLYQSLEAAQNGAEGIRGVFGGVARLGTLKVGPPDEITDDPIIAITDGTGTGAVVPNSAQQPSDVAADAANRLNARLVPSGFTLVRTAGGNVAGHDDESAANPNGTVVRRATDRYVVRRVDGSNIETSQLNRLVLSALIGGNNFTTDLVQPNNYFRGPVAELRVSYVKRLVKKRVYATDGSSSLATIAQYLAMWATAGIDENCAALTGSARQECRERNESAISPMDDLSNGSALSRYQAEVARGCDPFDPRTSKADFLIVVDDSGSMQKNIIAIQQGGRDIAFKLRNNAENLDWRIGMTTSNMGGGKDTAPNQNALLDTYVPYGSVTGQDYPKLVPAMAPNDPDAFVAYQHTAFDNDGSVKACEYGDSYSSSNPLVSPYCCAFSTNNNMQNPLAYLAACCSLPQAPSGTTSLLGVPYAIGPSGNFPSADFNLFDLNANPFGLDFSGNDTLRCYDFPRFSEDLQGWGTAVPRYPLTGNNPTVAQRMRHFNDYLCGKVADGLGPPLTPADRGPIELWGTRGHLWPPGFVGIDRANPRRDGANLLIRNADMLVVQMNRDCTGNDAGGNFVWSPRARNGSGVESMMQAAKRAVERATAAGRTGTATSLRADAPLVTIFLSDEEDYATKFRNVDTLRDTTPLPPARCNFNGDAGCTAQYCEACFAGALDRGTDPGLIASLTIPSARRYDEQQDRLAKDPVNGNYCMAPMNNSASVTTACPSPGATTDDPFCAAFGGGPTGPTASRRWDGFYKAPFGSNENGTTATDQTIGGNRSPDDWLNYTLDSSPVSCGCNSDCQPCMRYLRERPYIDFFSGLCSPPDVTNPSAQVANDDPRRYPRPAVALTQGNLVLPVGPVYAITRAVGQQGGAPGSCGSTHPGGDGQALRDLALGTGGGFANICPPQGQAEPSYADFLEQIIVDAQGLGSPYRLRGAPISSTLRVAVMDRFGKLRLLKRSTVSGFDFNASTNTIAFFSKGETDTANQVTSSKDAVVYVSYRVWKRPCPDDCAIGDSCSICTCSPARPECCTITPTFECQPPQCPTCGPCETCDPAKNICRVASDCGPQCTTCVSTTDGPKCDAMCPPGSIPVKTPCDPPGDPSCPNPPLTVCVEPTGIPNTGNSCAVTTDPDDCCGANKTCTGGKICVTQGCSGESCLPQALCEAPNGDGTPPEAWCGDCPDGTVCAPIPCAGESCQARFACITSGGSTVCEQPPECSCPGGVCSDCPVCSFCNAEKQCEPQCQPDVSTATCGSDPAQQAQPALGCCPPGEVFDPATSSCRGGCECDPACSANEFCDQISCRCLPRGG